MSPGIRKSSRAAFPVFAAPDLPFADTEMRSLADSPVRPRLAGKTALRLEYTRRSPWMLTGIVAGHVLILASLTEPSKPVVEMRPKTLTVQLIAPETPPEPLPKAAPVAKPARAIKPPPRIIATDAATTRISPSKPVTEPDTEAAPAIPVTEAAPSVTLPTPAPPTEVEPPPVVPPRFNADYLDNPKPPYPVLSQRLKEEGEVRLRVWVDAAGEATRVALFRSSGFERLDRIALETVQRWRFTPARQGDQAIAAQVIVPVTFNLRD
ncbi:MAG: energy transducer TonB [Thiobacillus sp.]